MTQSLDEDTSPIFADVVDNSEDNTVSNSLIRLL